jgi:GrpB-like predicted nucleotidyltransferase (UPF0157 family)
VEYDPFWPIRFAEQRAIITDALGTEARSIEHIGSTAVPGLPAKPIIDVDLTVPDPRAEDTYIPALEAAGFEFVWRERQWHEHRLLDRDDPKVTLHVFGPASPELVRHILIREWLRTHPEDAEAYADAKRAAAGASSASGEPATYNARKEPFLRDLLDRIFRAEGLL